MQKGEPATPRRKEVPWIIYLILLVLIVAFALAPIGSVAVAGFLANSHGCKLDEGSAHPCLSGGKARGELLYALGVLGWLMLITLPAGAVAFAVWLVVVLLHRGRWQRQHAISR